jgi:hypothetical protein
MMRITITIAVMWIGLAWLAIRTGGGRIDRISTGLARFGARIARRRFVRSLLRIWSSSGSWSSHTWIRRELGQGISPASIKRRRLFGGGSSPAQTDAPTLWVSSLSGRDSFGQPQPKGGPAAYGRSGHQPRALAPRFRGRASHLPNPILKALGETLASSTVSSLTPSPIK